MKKPVEDHNSRLTLIDLEKIRIALKTQIRYSPSLTDCFQTPLDRINRLIQIRKGQVEYYYSSHLHGAELERK